MQVLIVDDVHPILVEGLINENITVHYKPEITESDIFLNIHKYDGIVIRSKMVLGVEVLSNAANLKWIARAGSGMDNVDEAYVKTRNILCINAAEANAHSMGEHCVGLLLTLLNKINQADAQVRNKIWDREANRGVELNNKTIGIVGFGNTGKSVAKKLSGFGCKIWVYDKYLDNFNTAYAQQCEMETIFAECDVITFHVPLTNETKGMVNKQYLSDFKKPIYLLNTSRGKVINTIDLIDCIESGKVLGAGLDVLENEKMDRLSLNEQREFNYLIHSKRTVLTPHVAGWSKESYQKISEVLLLKIKELNKKYKLPKR